MTGVQTCALPISCYSDKVARKGIRVIDLISKEKLSKKLDEILPIKQKIYDVYEINKKIDKKNILDEYLNYGKKLKEYLKPVHLKLNKAIKNKENILFEGAQGTMLDVDFGTYPFTTSSHTISGGANIGSGVGPKNIDDIIGIVKAYTTRVGEGPLPTELFDKNGKHLQEKGREFGTTTSRPRRCGWLDLVVVKHSCIISGVTKIALTKLDVLDGLENIYVCINYDLNGKKIDYFPANIDDVEKCKPIYKKFEGWEEIDSSISSFSDLPKQAQNYIKFIEKELEKSVEIVSIGPGRNETIKV